MIADSQNDLSSVDLGFQLADCEGHTLPEADRILCLQTLQSGNNITAIR